MTAAYPEYLYIAVLGVITGFVYAFGIGANDVANSFGSSVASGALSLGWAIVLGSIFEFVGAIALGKAVTDTIRNKILDKSYYIDEPEILMFGNLCALMVGAIWLLLATKWEYPVSTTHTIVGALIGFSLAANGFESVYWWPNTGLIFIAWVACPVYSGIIGFIFFKTLKTFVLDSVHIKTRAVNAFPIVVFAGVTINIFFILQKGRTNPKHDLKDYGHNVVLPCSLGSGLLCALVTYFFVGPYLQRKVEREHQENLANAAAAEKTEEIEVGEATMEVDGADAETSEDAADDKPKDEPAVAKEAPTAVDDEAAADKAESAAKKSLWDEFASRTYKQDLKSMSFHENPRAAELWDTADHYDPEVEALYSYLQVFTACLASFAHGANDVANAIAPVSAILDIYNTGEANSKAPVQKWVLAMGGAGIALGFCLFGYKIIKAVGFKMTCITPSRGFCIELAAALAVSLASFVQIPVSTTQCLVGATAGVGLAGGGSSSISWKWLFKILFGWAAIFFTACIVNAGFFAFSAYSPSLAN